MSYFFENRAIDVYLGWSKWTLRAPLLRAAQRVEQKQNELLTSILQENAHTEFGREHNFASISNMIEYRACVPVQTYDQLEHYIARQQGGAKALTNATPAYYARTSGTTGRSKDIPLTKRGLQQVKHAQKHLALSLWQNTRFFRGSILGFASPVEEGRLKNGRAYGATSGITYQSLSPVLARKFILPYAAFSINDMEAKYQSFALAALAADDVTGIVAANPSSILKVVNLIDADAPRLLAALSSGEQDGLLSETIALLPHLKARTKPRRLKALRDALGANGRLAPDDIWPKLSAVATWTGGSCGVALGRLRLQLPNGVKIVEYGYGASEFMGSVNVDANANTCLPLLNDHVYEFVRRSDWEGGKLAFLGLHEIEPGEDYYIFMTTQSGLYRYNINDIVRAEPGVGLCPGLRFMQKGRGVTNITGEKLSEDQIIASVADVLAANGLSAEAFMALADEDASRYALYLECLGSEACETLAVDFDLELRARNSEYDDKRASGRLRPLKLLRLRQGAGETIKELSLERGMREAQYKPTLLDYSSNWTEKLAPLVVGSRP